VSLNIVPVTFRAAGAFVEANHRHHKPPRGVKFCIGVSDGDELVGVAMVGRPVARMYDDGFTVEVNRSCVVENAPNANSLLYAAAWRAAKAMGYRRIITYTQAGETGSSLRGAGWRVIAERAPRKGWDAPSRQRISHGVDNVQRTLWEAS